MSYLALDTETTGVNPKTSQILSIGAVIDDCESPISELPSCRFVLDHDRIIGDPAALRMNAGLIEEIAEGSEDLVQPEHAAVALAYWLENENGVDLSSPITVAGKNVGNFDIPFLEELDRWDDLFTTRSRTIDPTPLYFKPTEETVPPDLEECKRRAGFDDEEVAHDAAKDAMDVCRLLRHAK